MIVKSIIAYYLMKGVENKKDMEDKGSNQD